MAGFSQDPLQFIRLIADNLRDRYESGFPVLKEIIQNADDAGSENASCISVQLDFGLSPGIRNAQHSLLQGPALYFINDGDFTEQDNRAIHSFGLNSKAAENGSIGKFGLGMKSVFHFCEAFFFQAKGREPGKEYAEILNPWSSGSDDFERLHADWDDFSAADAKRMRDHLSAVLGWEKRATCFLLWLPLRQRKHLQLPNGQTAGEIIASFPGDEGEDNKKQLAFLHEPDLPQRLAALFPLLRRMTRICFWETPDAPEAAFTVELDERPNRISRNLEDTPEESSLRGLVRISPDGSEKGTATVFAGKQHLVDDARLLALKESPFWPKSYTRNPLGQSELAPDKTRGHCAAVFSVGSSGKSGGECVVNWAVFLPVGDELSEQHECRGSNKTFRLTLHGYFFVDAGRAGIEGFPRKEGLAPLDEQPADETALRRLWNSHLARLGVLPLILPSLKDFAAECLGKEGPAKLTDKDLWNLSRGLADSKTFRQYQSIICAEFYWVRRLTRKARGWQRVRARRALLRVLPPPPKSTPERPWVTFPHLSEFEKKGVVFVEKDAPHLVATPLPQWNVADLLEVLQIDAQTVFADRVLLEYLTQFLDMDEVHPFTKTGEIQARLREIFRRAFHAHGSALSRHREKVRTFTSFILPENRFRLNASDEVVQALQDAVPAKLLLNQDFDAQDNPGTARFTPDETLSLLRKLHELIVRNEDADTCRGIARDLVLALPDDDRRSVLNQAKELKILSGHDCLRGKQVALSIRELEDCRNQGLLFRFSAGIQLSQQLNVAPLLQAVIQERVLLVNNATFGLAFNNNDQVPPCDASAALAALGNTPFDLQGLPQRRQLLNKAGSANLQTPEQVRGLRYLLHGEPQHFGYQNTLWVPGDGAGGVWSKIWAHLQRDAANSWTLLDRQLVGFIPLVNWNTLGLKPVNVIGILDELRTRPDKLQGIDLSVSERETVLLAAAGNQYLWQGLPLHEKVDGELVSIQDRKAYLQSDTLQLPDGLAATIDLIVPSDNPQVRACQDRWIAPINPENILRIALNHDTPWQFCSLILDQLGTIGEARLDELVRQIPDYLLKKRWLLDADRNPVKPEDVIDLPEIADEVNRLVAEAKGVYSSPENLSNDVRRHENFSLLRSRTFSQDEHGLEKLALLLSDTPAYRIGKISLPDNTHELGKIAQVAQSLPDAARLRGWGLLTQVLDRYPDHWRTPANELCREIPSKKTRNVLYELQKKHESANRVSANAIIACFNLYLATFAAQAGKAGLENLMLLNRAGQWRTSAELCTGARGVADSHLLDDRQRDILYAVIDHANQRQQTPPDAPPRQHPTDLQPLLEESKNNLRSFFKKWRDAVPAEEMICALLLILGKSMEEVADEFKGKGSLDGILNQIPWETHYRWEAAGRQDWLYGIDKDAAFNMFDFLVSVTDRAANIQVTSILGDRISVPQQADFVSLIVGEPSYEPLPRDRYAIKIDLRRPDQQATSNALSDYLREAAECLLRKVYNQQHVNLSSLWAELDKYDQLDINVAQTLILKHLPSLFRQLGGVHRHVSLRDEFKKWEEAQRSAVEFREDEGERKNYEAKEAEHLQEIQRRVLSDGTVQEALLAAVRAKMKEFQYTPERIPFELFQNADDAVVEYLTMQCHPHPLPDDDGAFLVASNRRVVVAQADDTVYFAHWGRWINEVGVAPFPGRERGFHCDLEKMLMLSASDKAEDGSVTGKFGLGFKSVFLVSDSPKLISGRRLAAEIVGGLCPIPLENEDAAYYREMLNSLAPGATRPGTLVALPLDENAPADLIEDFTRRAGLLCIFAKRIRQIDIEGITEHGVQWQPSARLLGNARLEYGPVALSRNAGNLQGALYFRFPEGKGGILFGMNAKGFSPLPEELPGLWVVAPTEDAPGLGLAINGCFELDAGRRLLAVKNEGNAVQADALGRSFADALAGLHEASLEVENWPDLRNWLGLAGDVTQYDFWHSLWNVLAGAVKGKEGAGHEVVRRIVAGANGFGALLDRADALPNGLWGDFQCLTRPDSIKKVVKGVLAEEGFFRTICGWGFFKEYLGAPDEVTSERIVAQGKRLVSKFGSADFRYTPVRLSAVLHEFGNIKRQIEPEAAADLGALLKGLEKDERFANEQGEIKGELKAFLFRGEDGNFHESGELLIADSGASAKSEESRLAAFAPDEALLASEYQDDALTFFKICRGGFTADIDDMTEWFLAADTPNKQSAALRYLLEGNQGDELAERVRKEKSGKWVEGLDWNSQCFSGWDFKDQAEILLRRLPTLAQLQRGVSPPPPPPLARTQISPKDALKRIYDWWKAEQGGWIQDYERRTYPGLRPSFNLEEEDVGRFDRSSWLALFLLGHFHTMGRQRNVQHRAFIDDCVEEGWWDIFSKANPEKRSDEWMGILETYISNQVDSSQYEVWMNHYVSIYKLSRHLDSYREAFLSIDSHDHMPNLDGILKTLTNPVFQGGGIAAPPIDKTLGLGACFVVRELRRKGILKNAQVDPFCYVPVGRVRELCSSLGCSGLNAQGSINDSKIIYDFLGGHLRQDRVTFDGCYDIPLQILAEKDDQRQRILN